MRYGARSAYGFGGLAEGANQGSYDANPWLPLAPLLTTGSGASWAKLQSRGPSRLPICAKANLFRVGLWTAVGLCHCKEALTLHRL